MIRWSFRPLKCCAPAGWTGSGELSEDSELKHMTLCHPETEFEIRALVTRRLHTIRNLYDMARYEYQIGGLIRSGVTGRWRWPLRQGPRTDSHTRRTHQNKDTLSIWTKYKGGFHLSSKTVFVSRCAIVCPTTHLLYVDLSPQKSAHNKHEMFSKCWYNAGPASQTVGQHCTNIGWTSRVCWASECCWTSLLEQSWQYRDRRKPEVRTMSYSYRMP